MPRPRQVAGGAVGSVVIGGDNHAPVTTTVFTGAFTRLRDVWLDPRTACADFDPARFVGREWVFEAMDTFVRQQSRGFFVVEADAGLGKTTLAARLVLDNNFPAHFGGSTPQEPLGVALANLAAQLVAAYGLEDIAPGGFLPQTAGDPVWFSRVLAAAADAARRSDGRLILVIDGVDEMQTHPSGRPLGLPATLPDGVYVILTCRTGTRLSLAQPEQRLSIAASQQENLADIRRFLDRFAEEHLTELLAEAGLGKTEFIEAMTAACGGVWVYLRYLCDEVRDGRRNVGDLGQLPRDLGRYYIDNLHRWLATGSDRPATVRLLSALAAAREPLSLETLATFAAMSTHDAATLCRGPLRPFLSEQRDPGAVRYSIYHQSLVDFLTGRLRPEAGHEQGVVDELSEAVRLAHHRIAEHYLHQFGGLETGLALLARDPAAATVDHCYPLHHLVEHLNAVGEQQRLGHLLTLRASGESGEWANVWFVAHERAGTMHRYLADVHMAWQAVKHYTDQSLRQTSVAESLGTEVAYSFLAVAAVDQVDQLPVPLLCRLVEAGYWDLSQALQHSMALPDPARRIDALSALYPIAPPSERHHIRTVAMGCVNDLQRSSGSGGDNLRALISLGRALPATDLPLLLAAQPIAGRGSLEAENFLGAVASVHPEVVAELAAVHLSLGKDRVWRRTAAVADSVRWAATILLHPSMFGSDDDLLMTAALTLANHMPKAAADAIVASCEARARTSTGLSDEARRLAPLLRLTPRERFTSLAADLLAKCRDAADKERVDALCAVVADLPQELLADALAVTRTLPQALATPILTTLAPRLDADGFSLAVQATGKEEPEATAAKALADIAGHVPARLFPQALEMAISVTDERQRDQVLSALAPNTPAAHANEMLEHLQVIADPEHRSVALAALIPYLPAHRARQVGRDVLQTIRTVGRDQRIECLSTVAPLLPPALLGDALALARTTDISYSQAYATATLAKYLPRTRYERICAHLLSELAPRYRDADLHILLKQIIPGLPPDALDQAARLARTIRYVDLRPLSLSRIALRVQGELQQELLAEVAASFESSWQPDSFELIAPLLPSEVRERLLAAAIHPPAAAEEDLRRWERLQVALKWLPEPQRVAATTRAIEELLGSRLDIHSGELAAAAQVIGEVTPDRFDDLLGAITGIAEPERRGRAMVDVAGQVTEAQAAVLLAAAQQLPAQLGSDIAAALAPRLSHADLEALCAQLFTESSGWSGKFERHTGARALVACNVAQARACRSDGDRGELLEPTLRMVSTVEGPEERVELLVALIPVLPTNLLSHALHICCATPRNDLERSTLTRRLATAAATAHRRVGGQPCPDVLQLFRHTLHGAYSSTLLQVVIPETAELIADYGGEQAIERCLPIPFWPRS